VNAREFVAMLSGDPTKSLQILRAFFERLRILNARLSEQTAATQPAVALPRIKLLPLTPETSGVLSADGLNVTRFPFRIGREPEPDEHSALRFNNLDFPDTSPHLLSLPHFAFDLGHEGVIVRARGSQLGTAVNGARIGTGSAVDVAPLHVGENEVVAGVWQLPPARHTSPFRWRVILE